MKLLKPHNRIFLVTAKTAAELGRAFVRIQEFYESPYKRFRRRVFSLETFQKFYRRCVNQKGRFTYYTDFYGYNVPSDVFMDWQVAYAGQETEDESALLSLLGPLPDQFYLIGAGADNIGTINHELAHAFFHLFPVYRDAVKNLMAEHDLSGVYHYLKSHMYEKSVFDDEAQAYLMFDHHLMNRRGVEMAQFKDLRRKLISVFEDWAHMQLRPRGEWSHEDVEKEVVQVA